MEMKNLQDAVPKTARPVKTGNCLVCDTKKRVFVKMDKDTAAAKRETKTPASPKAKPKAKKKSKVSSFYFGSVWAFYNCNRVPFEI